MEKIGLISVILPVYNGEDYLEEAIKSCLDQSYSNFELIIIDDGSSDATLKIATDWSMEDSRIKVLSNEVNRNLPYSLNIGHKLAKGEYITWTSHDNLYQRGALEALVSKLKNSNADIVYADYLLIDKEGSIRGKVNAKSIDYLLFTNVIGPCFLYKRNVYLNNTCYNESLYLLEDFDFWIRSLKNSRFVKIDNPGYYFYRYHPDSLTMKIKKDKELNRKFLKNVEQCYKGVFNEVKLKNPDFIIQFFVDRLIRGVEYNIKSITSNYFFRDLKTIAFGLKQIRYQKLKTILIKELVTAINEKKISVNFLFFIKLHIIAGKSLFSITIEDYFRLCYRSIF
ncbi:MAG: glycosyl transferase [Flavobacteriaceae bacterium]|nr:glycosyl transferase [Flavobacteriaceae bacterium]